MPGSTRPVSMPDGLTPRATVLLVAVAFGLTFCVQATPGSGVVPARTG